MSTIHDLPPIEAPADVMQMARENCAERLRERGHEREAAAFERCERNWAWMMRHEVAKLLGEGMVGNV
jgi:hypothetical protein